MCVKLASFPGHSYDLDITCGKLRVSAHNNEDTGVAGLGLGTMLVLKI